MTQRIPSRELYILRNAIPIDRLIRASPALAAKETEGTFRFLCPLCSHFNTATNPKTNLARCFNCNKNFNTIDLVMLVQNLKFKDAVALLSSHFLASGIEIPQRSSPKALTSIPSASSSSFYSIRQVLQSALAKNRSEPNST